MIPRIVLGRTTAVRFDGIDLRMIPRIALSRTTGEPYPRYLEWLRLARPELEAVDLSTAGSEAISLLRTCHGLLLPGGPDLAPARYHHPELRHLCLDLDEERDQLELASVAEALSRRLPLLGICRGLQLVNVALGGTLVADLPRAGQVIHHRLDAQDRLHDLRVAEGSLLAELVHDPQRESGARARAETINSTHHQAAEIIAPVLRPTGWAEDGVIEALEWQGPEPLPFFLLVQWHPERMPQVEGPCLLPLARAFLAAAVRFAEDGVR